MHITSRTNPRVKHVVALREKKQRDSEGLMLVEGFDPLTLALDCGVRPREVYVCPELFKPAHAPDAHAKLLDRVKVLSNFVATTSRPVFEKMAYRDGPDGWLAVVDRPHFSLSGIVLPDATSRPPLILVAEAVEKPGNIGAMLRTCDAVGADAFLFCDPKADITNPNVVRASQGTLFSLGVACCSNEQAFEWLRAHRIRIIATTPNLISGVPLHEYTNIDMTGPCAIVVGEEKYGLSKFWLSRCDLAAQVPMFGRINSLNVATAAALLLYEALRQRRSQHQLNAAR